MQTRTCVGKAIQMFLALKLLGKTVEFVQVDGENHGVADYKKRLEWQNTIFALVRQIPERRTTMVGCTLSGKTFIKSNSILTIKKEYVRAEKPF